MNSFDIDVATGQLSTKAALDRETTPTAYEVQVTVTDPFPGTNNDTIMVNITVTNVDEAPELTGMESIRFAENTAVATPVTTYTVTDDEDDFAQHRRTPDVVWGRRGRLQLRIMARSPSSSLPTTKAAQRMRAPTTYTT